MENVFLTEFMPLLESTYRVDTAQRAIGGISRGGSWAYEIAFRHPQLFRAVGGHSAFLTYCMRRRLKPLDRHHCAEY